MGAKESGQAFLDSVMARVPEERRAALSELAPDLAELIGEGVLRQEDYSRHMDAIRAKHQEQTDWFATNQAAADLGRKAAQAGFDPTKPTSGIPAPALPDDVVRRGDLEKDARAFVTLTGLTATLVAQHSHEFGEPLDVVALLNDPKVSEIGLTAVYNQSVAQKRADKAKAATDAEVERRVKEGVQQALRSSHNPSFPGAVPAGSPLDGLLAEIEKESGKPDLSVEALAQAYEVVKAGGSI